MVFALAMGEIRESGKRMREGTNFTYSSSSRGTESHVKSSFCFMVGPTLL